MKNGLQKMIIPFLFFRHTVFLGKETSALWKNGNLHKSFYHSLFAESMKKCKHKWLITYDDSDYIGDLFSFPIFILGI